MPLRPDVDNANLHHVRTPARSPERPLKRQRTDSEKDTTRTTGPGRQDQHRYSCPSQGVITYEEPASAPNRDCQLCTICSTLGLEKYFAKEVRETKAGHITAFKDPSCPFCSLISTAMSSHWTKSDWRNSIKPTAKLFLKSKCWAYSMNEDGKKTYYTPRLLLAADIFPPTYSLGRSRISADSNGRFIILELELMATTASSQAKSSIKMSPAHLRWTIEPRLDMTLVKNWLDGCRKHKHSRKTSPVPNDLFQTDTGFRVVDVIEEHLVELNTPCEYVALSYVWGACGSSTLKCTRTNVHQLLQRKSLSRENLVHGSEKRIPLTIRNAMEFVQKVGLRFLWVDALCIIQDDESEKARLIHGMDRVYENAVLTIIAAAGEDADAGLPGIWPRRREIAPSVISTGGFRLQVAAAHCSLVEWVRRSYWNTRGWTFQEQSLSRRCVYFTPHEVFFVCEKSKWREGYILENIPSKDFAAFGRPFWNSNKTDPDSSPSVFLTSAEELGFEEYMFAVQAYSRRNLTFTIDVLNAFAGCYNKFCPDADISAMQGLPTSMFPGVLLWYPGKGCIRRVDEITDDSPTFPSWSWTSWQGPIEFLQNHSGFRTLLDRWWSSFVDNWYCQNNQSSEASGVFTLHSSARLDHRGILNRRPLPAIWNFRKPMNLDSGTPPLHPTTRQLSFWAPFLRFNPQFDASHGYRNCEWVHQITVSSSMQVIFDEANSKFTEEFGFVVLSSNALPPPVFGAIAFLCVEDCGNFMIRKGIGHCRHVSGLRDETSDYWRLLPEFLEWCGWKFIALC